MNELKSGNTQRRWQTAMRDPAFDLIRQRKLIETWTGDFIKPGAVAGKSSSKRG